MTGIQNTPSRHFSKQAQITKSIIPGDGMEPRPGTIFNKVAVPAVVAFGYYGGGD